MRNRVLFACLAWVNRAKTERRMVKPPVAKKLPHRTEVHGDVLVDDYFWMREKTDPEVIAHLKGENAYTDAVLAPLADLRAKLFAEMKGRLVEDDRAVPFKDGDYYYYTRMEPGRQYPLSCRKHLSLEAPEEVFHIGKFGHPYMPRK